MLSSQAIDRQNAILLRRAHHGTNTNSGFDFFLSNKLSSFYFRRPSRTYPIANHAEQMEVNADQDRRAHGALNINAENNNLL